MKNFERRMNLGQGVPSHIGHLVEQIKQASAFYGNSTIILDALDECDLKTRENLITRLTKLSIDSRGCIKLLISSRSELDIKELVEESKISHYNSVDIINLADEDKNLKSDLDLYVNECIQSQRRLKKLDKPLQKEIKAALLEDQTL